MTMTVDDLRSCIGREVVDRSGERSGKVESVFYDTTTNEPAWLAVHTGLFGRHSTLVPLAGARTEGDAIRVPYEKETIKAAPQIEDDRPIDTKEAEELITHYGLGGGRSPEAYRTTDRRPSGDGEGLADRDQERSVEPTGTEATGAHAKGASAGKASDDAMTRSEEELFVGMETNEAGRARLRKWIETEPIDRTITVAHEEARIVREPITEGNVDQAMSGPDLTEHEFEVTLHEERAVVEKRVVPKERVRLETERVEEQREIHDELRKEKIEFEDETAGKRRSTPR